MFSRKEESDMCRELVEMMELVISQYESNILFSWAEEISIWKNVLSEVSSTEDELEVINQMGRLRTFVISNEYPRIISLLEELKITNNFDIFINVIRSWIKVIKRKVIESK